MKKSPYLAALFLAFAQAETVSLSPALHINGVVGTSTAEHPEDFAPGGHDPKRDEAVLLQSLEPSVSLRAGKHLEGFATATGFTDDQDNFDWEGEEYFFKLMDGEGKADLRGGRFLSRVGFHNPTHLHGWETVDMPLPHALMLGEEGLSTEGADLTLYLDTPWATALTFGFGQRPAHDHAHDHAEEEHEEHAGEGEEHHHEEGGFEAFEGLRPSDSIMTVALRSNWRIDDFHAWSGALAAGTGDSEEGEKSSFGFAGLEYQWRENGFEPGGRSLLWRTEVLGFSGTLHGEHEEEHGEVHGEEEHHDGEEHAEGDIDADGVGVSTLLAYQASERLRPFARIDHVAKVGEIASPDWTRYSLGLTVNLNANPNAYARIQTNFDERGVESEQAVWLQLGLDVGGHGGEVR